VTPRPPARGAVEPLEGANVVGYFRSETGTGEVARQIVNGLDNAGLRLIPVHAPTDSNDRQGYPFSSAEPTEAGYGINLICVDAEAMPELVRAVGYEFFAGCYSIGCWSWELPRLLANGWSDELALLDEVWAPSRHAANVLSTAVPVPVTTVLLPVEVPATVRLPRYVLQLPSDDFLFLCSFDYRAGFERKNPLAVVEAFCAAFEPGSRATLVIKTMNADTDPAGAVRLREAVAGRPDVRLIEEQLGPEEKDGLTAACDCYVSLHRAVGFGLAIAEAMFLGKPAIATGYSGNLEFMTSDNSYLVDYELAPIGSSEVGEWARPSITHAARVMRDVFERPDEALERGRRGAADLRAHRSPHLAGRQMLSRLQAVDARVSEPPGDFSDLPLARATARRALVRAIRPVTTQYGEQLDRLARCAVRASADRLRQTRLDAARMRSLRAAVVERIEDHSRRLARIEAEAHAIPFMHGAPFAERRDPVAGLVLGYRGGEDVGMHSEYRGFEDVFRGSEQFIRDRQRRYLPIIGDREPVLDFGCGRGELLDLLREAGVSYLGVDSDAGMIARCHDKAHTGVTQADGLDYLERLSDRSLGAMFAAQVIEHLTEQQLRRLLKLARVKLIDRGLLIAETVNPHYPPALKTFWVDLTHRVPIFPEVALELCREAGFASAYFFHPNGTGDVDRDRFTQGEFAVVATAGPSRPPGE
jgi:SAM-dependent methyltransferase